MRFAAAFLAACFAAIAVADSVTVTNKLVFIDGDGRNNAPEFLASVATQTSNETAVVVAAARAEAAVSTAEATTNALQDVVASIMSNNLVIYSYGNHDSFSVAVMFDETDEVRIIETDTHKVRFTKSGSTLTAVLPFIVTADIGATKPSVFGTDSLTTGFSETEIPDANVTAPVAIEVPSDIEVPAGKTAHGYEITVTVTGVTGSSYFFKLNLSGDAPAGDGSTLDLPNGVRDGVTETIPGTGGWPTLKFVGGVLTEVSYE